MGTVTSLTEDKIVELTSGWVGVSLSQDELNALVGQLWTNQGSFGAELSEFKNITLPQLEADLAAGSTAVSDLNGTTIPDLEAELAQHRLELTNLNTVDIPGLNAELASANSWFFTLEEETFPALDASLTDLNDRLVVVEAGGGGGFDPTELNAAIAALQDKFPVSGDDIQANTITSNNIEAHTITALEILADTITANEIAADSITANEIAAHTITSAEIFADTITANEIAADSITANEIAGRTITALEIATDTLTANEIAADSITANEIAADTITANEIAANAITATEILADTITANEIAANAITANEIAADAITAAKIKAGEIVSTHVATTGLDAAVIKFGTMSGSRIDAGTITATQLSATAIDGKTITGATVTGGTFRTASSGQRILIDDDGTGGVVKGFTGDVAESAPTRINPMMYASGVGPTRRQQLYLSSGSLGGGVGGFTIRSGSADSTIAPAVVADGDFRVNGPSTLDGTVTIEASTFGRTITARAGFGGFVDADMAGGGTTPASINNNGHLFRSPSTRDLKKNIKALKLDDALKVLLMEAVTFQWKNEAEFGTGDQPGFIAEQAEEAGASLWVTRDQEKKPSGIRHGEITSAHNVILKDALARIAELEAAILKGHK